MQRPRDYIKGKVNARVNGRNVNIKTRGGMANPLCFAETDTQSVNTLPPLTPYTHTSRI